MRLKIMGLWFMGTSFSPVMARHRNIWTKRNFRREYMNLGKLSKVDLRTIWESEAGDFTRGRSSENIKLLGDTIGLELEVEAQEKEVGLSCRYSLQGYCYEQLGVDRKSD
jgi:hypothetical protein